MKEKNKQKKIFCKKAFSIGEVIISVFIVAIVMTTILRSLAKDFSISLDNKNKVVASYLSQEGVELVKNIRDTNWAQGKESFICTGAPSERDFPIGDSTDCRIDKNSLKANDCGSGDYKLYIDSDGFYGHDASGEISGFQRRMEFKYDSGNCNSAENAIVTSVVIWGNDWPLSLSDCNFSNKCIYSQSILTKWAE